MLPATKYRNVPSTFVDSMSRADLSELTCRRLILWPLAFCLRFCLVLSCSGSTVALLCGETEGGGGEVAVVEGRLVGIPVFDGSRMDGRGLFVVGARNDWGVSSVPATE